MSGDIGGDLEAQPRGSAHRQLSHSAPGLARTFKVELVDEAPQLRVLQELPDDPQLDVLRVDVQLEDHEVLGPRETVGAR